MARFSKRTEAVQYLKASASQDAVLFILEEHADQAEIEMLQTNPNNPDALHRLVKAQILRQLQLQLASELK